MPNDFRVFSFGGGVQSLAVLLLALDRRVHYDAFVFANVGGDSENRDTLDYLARYVRPICQYHGFLFVVLQRQRAGKPDTLLSAIYRDNRSIPIPAHMSNGAPGNRTCTADYKIRVVDRWISRQGFDRATVGLGISRDEVQRVKDCYWHEPDPKHNQRFWKRREYPLIDLLMSRRDCERVILAHALPIPPKSACWFCPFHNAAYWIDLKAKQPALFAAALDVEAEVNRRRAKLGKDNVYLHGSARSLDKAVGSQLSLWAEDCDGYCHT